MNDLRLNNDETFLQDTWHDIDPDENLINCLFANYGSITNSSYFTADAYNSTFSKNLNYFSIFHQNVRSVNHKIDKITTFFESLSKFPDVFIFTETWLNDITKLNCNFNHCDSYHTTRLSRTGGGVSVFVNNNFNSMSISDLCLCNDTIETCTVQVRYDDNDIIIIAIYRPHSGTVQNFTSALIELLNNKKMKGKQVIITGDININLLQFNVSYNEHFINELQSLNFVPVITKPTRFPPENSEIQPSLLDHIWLNFFQENNSGIILSDISDHNTVFLHLPIRSSFPDKVRLAFRSHNNLSMELFRSKLCKINWSNLLTGDMNQQVQIFNSVINEIYCNTFTLKIKYVSSKRITTPWLTRGILNSVKTKSKLFKLLKLGRIHSYDYSSFCNKLKSIIRLAKIKYYKSAFITCKNNIKDTWKLLNNLLCRNIGKRTIQSIIVNNENITNEKLIANEFNNYFSNIANILNDEIPLCNLSPEKSILFKPSGSFYCCPTDTNEVCNIILKLKKSSSGISNVPVRILRRVSDLLSLPISSLINVSFNSGIFPQTLKLAHVIPVHKQGDKTCIENYRPISILPTLSKIFERCMATRLLSYMRKFNILTPNQFGFTKGRSTVDAILSFINLIHTALNDKKHVVSIFVDLKKAFDTVNHGILMSKLECYGLRGNASLWISDYLRDRKQCIKIGSSLSDVKTLNIGVPQGSVLAPILFLLYINDLVNVSDFFHYVLFADDTTICSSHENFDYLVCNVNTELEKINKWMLANKLSLNLTKTHSVIFSKCDYNVVMNPIIFNEKFINIETHGKFLGVIIDNKLNYRNHISFICNKLSKTAGILNKIKNIVPIDIMIQLYYSLAYPYIHYCNLVWGNTYHTHLNSITIIQKKLIRIITNSDYFEHTNHLFNQTRILTINKLHDYLLCIYMFKLKNSASGLPTLDHNYETRHRDNVAPPFQRLTICQQSILYAGSQVWNKLPNDIKNCKSLPKFKILTKKLLLES